MSITKRLEALEQRVQVAPAQKMKIIGTALAVTANEPHTTTSDNMVTFHNKTLAAAFEQRQVWLSEQPAGVVAMVSPLDSGRCVEKVLAERHADE